ncbi:MAG: putative TetR-family transcriptional regulator [Sphaerisporangium sp.]|jgi:AcrR family transcriptional regulator|nr:putative TetR-family transcriptional regulator [Sphaerisporangium sp.]
MPTRRPYDSRGRQDAARRNRAAVLTACRDLLFLDGYRSTTIRSVADRAGVSPETVYKAFGNKPGLLKALWDVTLAGDDEPLTMAERPALHEVWRTRDPQTKLRLYAGFVHGVHDRLAALFAVLTQAGPEVAQVLTTSEEERLTGVAAFVAHLAHEGILRPDTDQVRTTDACWALTGPHLFTELIIGRGWDADTYQQWLADMLAATLLNAL